MAKHLVKKRTKSQIGKSNRRKGGVGEREIVHILMNAGCPTNRISMLETGHILKGDIQFKKFAAQEKWYIGQVKNELAVPEYMYKNLEKSHALFMKKPRARWLVCFYLEEFIKEYLT